MSSPYDGAAIDRRKWTPEEDALLTMAMNNLQDVNETRWTEVAASVPGRSAKACRKRWVNGLNERLKKGTWTTEEDNRLREAIMHLDSDWARIAEFVGNRSGDQCSKRWREVLDPTINKAPWTAEEDRLLVEFYHKHGSCWQVISTYLNNRRALQCRNRCCKLLGLHAHPRKKATCGNKQSPTAQSFSASPSMIPTQNSVPAPSNLEVMDIKDTRKLESDGLFELNSHIPPTISNTNATAYAPKGVNMLDTNGQTDSCTPSISVNGDIHNNDDHVTITYNDVHTMGFLDAWSKVQGYSSAERKGLPAALNLSEDNTFYPTTTSPTDSIYSYLDSTTSLPSSTLTTPCATSLGDGFLLDSDFGFHSMAQHTITESNAKDTLDNTWLQDPFVSLLGIGFPND